MNLLRAALCCLLLATARAEDLRDSLTPAPGKFPALRPLTASYEFGWSGIVAAEAETEFSKKQAQRQLDLTVKTRGMARSLWRMDSKATSLCEAATLRPTKLTQTETYAKKTLVTVVDFTPAGPVALKTETPAGKKPPKPKTFKFPAVHDLQSALLFLRSQPLRQGDTVRLCVFPGSSPYVAEVSVRGRGTVKAASAEWPAIQLGLKLRPVKKDFTLGEHKKFKKATAWLSDDADRLLLKIEAEVFVGSVWAELKRVSFTK